MHRRPSPVGVKSDRSKYFHSFRGTLAQALEKTDLDGPLIDRLIGHAAKTTRGKHYNRDPKRRPNMPVVLLREKLDQLDWGANFQRSARWTTA